MIDYSLHLSVVVIANQWSACSVNYFQYEYITVFAVFKYFNYFLVQVILSFCLQLTEQLAASTLRPTNSQLNCSRLELLNLSVEPRPFTTAITDCLWPFTPDKRWRQTVFHWHTDRDRQTDIQTDRRAGRKEKQVETDSQTGEDGKMERDRQNRQARPTQTRCYKQADEERLTGWDRQTDRQTDG